MTTQITTTDWRTLNAQGFIDSVANGDHSYYVWAGQHIPTSVTPLISDDQIDSSVDPYHNMIFGKIVTRDDVALLINNNPYVSGTVYTAYDDGDPVLMNKPFFVTVDTGSGSYKHVFKVLDNNNGSPSSVAPDFSQVNISDQAYRTSDDYLWKYMYSVDQNSFTKFSISTGMLPVIANTITQSTATPGSIDVVAISNTGSGYDNYLTGQFGKADSRYNGNTLTYSISGNTSSNNQKGFYTGCLIYISSGLGIGQNKTITDHFSNTSGNFIVIDSEFPITPLNGSTYEIYPNVVFIGDGDQTVNAVGRALVNAVGNTIYRVEMLNTGLDYTYAAASVVANDVVGIDRPAVIRPIYAPPGGHGSDPATELGAVSVAVSSRFSNNESNTISTQNGFRQIGIMCDPMFANVVLNLSSHVGTFLTDETVMNFAKFPVSNNISYSNGVMTGSNTYFDQQFGSQDYIYMISADGVYHAVCQVNNVINATSINVLSNVAWACSSLTIYKATPKDFYTVRSFNGTGNVAMQPMLGTVAANDFIVGLSSGAYGTVNSVYINGITKSFSTFDQLYHLNGGVSGGQFTQNEIIYQGSSLANSTANAVLHSFDGSVPIINLYLTNKVGNFNLNAPVYGATSGASMQPLNSHIGDIVPRSGRNLFIENLDYIVPRSTTETETITMVMKF